MKHYQRLTFFLGLLVSNVVMAGENPACHNPTQAFFNHQATELRNIAASCADNEVARLFYNRAYYKDLLVESKILSNLIQHNAESANYQITAYQLYIAMVEEFAPLYYPNIQQRIDFLNLVYERRSEVVELRLHGNNKLADVLERKILF